MQRGIGFDDPGNPFQSSLLLMNLFSKGGRKQQNIQMPADGRWVSNSKCDHFPSPRGGKRALSKFWLSWMKQKEVGARILSTEDF